LSTITREFAKSLTLLLLRFKRLKEKLSKNPLALPFSLTLPMD
jgi:hypothetical protein